MTIKRNCVHGKTSDNNALKVKNKLGLCLGWKGQCIYCVTRGERGREGGGREGRGGEGREVGGGRGGREGGRRRRNVREGGI